MNDFYPIPDHHVLAVRKGTRSECIIRGVRCIFSYQVIPRPSGSDVVLAETEGNPGLSVTNVHELLATHLRGRLLLDSMTTRWFELYDPRSGVSWMDAHLDLVTMRWDPDRFCFLEPSWLRVVSIRESWFDPEFTDVAKEVGLLPVPG